jgi:hypothetical protein
MTIISILISIIFAIFFLELYRRFVNWLRKFLTNRAVKKQTQSSDSFCVLTVLPNGTVKDYRIPDEIMARESYKTALNLNEDSGSYIALFSRGVLIDSNQERRGY